MTKIEPEKHILNFLPYLFHVLINCSPKTERKVRIQNQYKTHLSCDSKSSLELFKDPIPRFNSTITKQKLFFSSLKPKQFQVSTFNIRSNAKLKPIIIFPPFPSSVGHRTVPPPEPPPRAAVSAHGGDLLPACERAAHDAPGAVGACAGGCGGGGGGPAERVGLLAAGGGARRRVERRVPRDWRVGSRAQRRRGPLRAAQGVDCGVPAAGRVALSLRRC